MKGPLIIHVNILVSAQVWEEIIRVTLGNAPKICLPKITSIKMICHAQLWNAKAVWWNEIKKNS